MREVISQFLGGIDGGSRAKSTWEQPVVCISTTLEDAFRRHEGDTDTEPRGDDNGLLS